MRDEPGAGRQAEADLAADTRMLVVEVEGQRYGLRLEQVREIVRAVAITRLSGAPGVIAGVIDVRGTVVPVLDLRARFRMERRAVAPTDHFVIVRGAERQVALHVDGAQGLEGVEAAALDGAERLPGGAEYLAGAARLADGLVLIYDPDAFLSEAEREALDSALASTVATGASTG